MALLVAIPFVVYISFLYGRVKKFTQTFKPQVVKLVLDFIDDGPLFGDLAYRPNQKVALQKFMASGIGFARQIHFPLVFLRLINK